MSIDALQLHLERERGPSVHLLTGLLITERGDNHDLIAMLPVHRRCYGVLCGQLQRVDHPQDLHVAQRTESGIAVMSHF